MPEATAEKLQFYVAGHKRSSKEPLEVHSPADGRLVGVTYRASARDVDEAIDAAVTAFPTMRGLTSGARSRILQKASQLLEERTEIFARSISDEAGKPMKDARGEVGRAVLTFSTAAGEAVRIGGEWLPLDVLDSTAGQWGLIRRFPLGPIGAITPFNFPLNLVAHKLAPAIAAGNTVVLKPASATPLTSIRLGALLYEAGLPPNALSVLPCSSSVGEALATDERLKMLTFTGSPSVGWRLKQIAGKKRVTLELGGNAGVIIQPDANLAHAAKRCAVGAFAYSGQSCISVQRIFVQQSVLQEFQQHFLERVRALQLGDPGKDSTDVGPMIDEDAARRAEAWVQEAVAQGARLLHGGKRDKRFLEPTVLTDTTPQMKVNCEEVFAPVVTIIPYERVETALEQLNNSTFGLQAGLFTRDVGLIFEAYDRLELGGLMINEIPSYRVDPMPYGGVKDSGTGREGIRWTIQEMTEEKLLLYNPAGL